MKNQKGLRVAEGKDTNKCDNCGKKPWSETMNHCGDMYCLCKKCYREAKYGE